MPALTIWMLNLIQIQKWSFGMWETSPPAAPLLLKATVYT